MASANGYVVRYRDNRSESATRLKGLVHSGFGVVTRNTSCDSVELRWALHKGIV